MDSVGHASLTLSEGAIQTGNQGDDALQLDTQHMLLASSSAPAQTVRFAADTTRHDGQDFTMMGTNTLTTASAASDLMLTRAATATLDDVMLQFASPNTKVAKHSSGVLEWFGHMVYQGEGTAQRGARSRPLSRMAQMKERPTTIGANRMLGHSLPDLAVYDDDVDAVEELFASQKVEILDLGRVEFAVKELQKVGFFGILLPLLFVSTAPSPWRSRNKSSGSSSTTWQKVMPMMDPLWTQTLTAHPRKKKKRQKKHRHSLVSCLTPAKAKKGSQA